MALWKIVDLKRSDIEIGIGNGQKLRVYTDLHTALKFLLLACRLPVPC